MSSNHRQFIEHHPIIGHLYVPDMEIRISHENGGYWLKTNRQGFRSDFDYSTRKTKNIRRIAVFGDSFTAGDGVTNSHRYTEVLRQQLPSVEVFNFGLTHSGTDQQFLIFREIAQHYQPDVVIISPMVENIRRNMRKTLKNKTHDGRIFDREKPYFEHDGGRISLRNVPVSLPRLSDEVSPTPVGRLKKFRQKLSHVKLGLETSAISNGIRGRKQLYPEYANDTDPSWQLLKAILSTWREEVSCPVVLAPIPWYLQYTIPSVYDSLAYRSRFLELKSSGFNVFDCMPSFLKYSAPDRNNFVYEHDKHFTQLGHKVFGDALADFLIDMRSL